MIGYLVHLATVTILALGVVPLGLFVTWGGLHDFKDARTVRPMISSLAFTTLGVALVVLPLILFANGVVK